MFSGPSGTGKTLAARILATRLKMYIYRVGLAAIVNKYIGETEKRLRRILPRAEELDVILLLEEGECKRNPPAPKIPRLKPFIRVFL